MTAQSRRRAAPPPPAGRRNPRRPAAIAAAILIGGIVVVGILRRDGIGDVANLRTAEPEGGILVVGDSLAAGVGAGAGESWPEVVARSLGCRVENAGVSGNTTSDGLARIDDLLATRRFVVVVELGGNDFLRKLPKDETERNLDAMLAKVAASGAIPVLGAIELGLFTDEYGEVYERVAERRRALLVPDLMGGVLGDPTLMSDQIHPNAAGHRKIADRVTTRLRALFEAAGKSCR